MLVEHGVFPHEVLKLSKREKILMLELLRKEVKDIKARKDEK